MWSSNVQATKEQEFEALHWLHWQSHVLSWRSGKVIAVRTNATVSKRGEKIADLCVHVHQLILCSTMYVVITNSDQKIPQRTSSTPLILPSSRFTKRNPKPTWTHRIQSARIHLDPIIEELIDGYKGPLRGCCCVPDADDVRSVPAGTLAPAPAAGTKASGIAGGAELPSPAVIAATGWGWGAAAPSLVTYPPV